MSNAVIPSAPAPPSGGLTVAEFSRRYGHRYVELIRGVVREIPMPFARHGIVCGQISRYLGNFVEDRDLGRIITNDSFVQTETDPDTLVGAEVSYYCYERLPRGPIPEGILPVQPDLVVEVRSPSNTWTAIFGKVSDYLKVGVRAVVVLDPATVTASVYRAEAIQVSFRATEDLVVPEVLAGFAVRVEKLFG